ncbi:hypothetical protein ACMFMF_007200 [Clarireedia jacksonii]
MEHKVYEPQDEVGLALVKGQGQTPDYLFRDRSLALKNSNNVPAPESPKLEGQYNPRRLLNCEQILLSFRVIDSALVGRIAVQVQAIPQSIVSRKSPRNPLIPLILKYFFILSLIHFKISSFPFHSAMLSAFITCLVV